MSEKKRIVLLVGPKGAGKSTIGDLLQRELGIPFLRVEAVWLAVRDRVGAAHPEFERLGHEAVIVRISEELTRTDTLCIESTGASKHTPWFLEELGKLAHVLPVRILAEPQLCKERIRTRDASIHIPVSDDQVERINELAFQVDLPWAAEIDNRGPFAPGYVLTRMRGLLA